MAEQSDPLFEWVNPTETDHPPIDLPPRLLPPPWVCDRLPAEALDRIKAEIHSTLPPAKGAKPATPQCEWQGCSKPGTELHHTLEQEIGGRLSEFAAKVHYCHEHHRIVTDLRNASMSRP